jgi:DNA-directed RNA polymerase sigma subunit (sigma70/sigma32)
LFSTHSHRQQDRFSRTALKASRKIDVGIGEGMTNFPKDLLNHELLSARDELQLSRQYKLGLQVKAQRKVMATKLGRDATDEELAKSLGLTSEEHLNVIINRGKDSKKALVKANMRLVFHISKYYRFRGVAYPDLVQEGDNYFVVRLIDSFLSREVTCRII